MSFAHLHTHTEYSVLDGVSRVKPLLERAKELDMPAMAITDHGYMFGAIDFYQTALNVGVKPVIGCEVYFTPDSRKLREGKPNLYHLLLLARDNVGYQNLMSLCSHAAIGGFYYKPRVDIELLRRFSKGLIGTSACMSGLVSKLIENGNPDAATNWAETFSQTFDKDSFYLEIQNQKLTADNGVTQSQLTRAIASIGDELGLPLVATNDIHYINQKDSEAQDIMLCIGTGSQLSDPNRMKFSCDQFYCKSPTEMKELFVEYPSAISNSLAIAEQCNVDLEFDKIILPVFEVPEGMNEESQLRTMCLAGLIERYGDPLPDEVVARFEHEIKVIADKGICAYFLIVADFTHWAKSQEIGVGPGRGSAAGSIIAYALSITDIDPLEYGLLFERFLNPERTEMPDIDMDFDDLRRGEVIQYVRDKYGDDKVAQIVTFNRSKAKMAVRDVGRVLGYAYNVPDRIAQKLVLSDNDTTLEKSIEGNPDYKKAYAEDGDVKRITDEALRIEGVVRGEGVHAAAVVIAPKRVSEFVPVKQDTKGGAVITQYDGPTVAHLGLLKMDFLGLRNLSVIQRAIANIEKNHGILIKEADIPFDDPETFGLLSRGDTAGVFQVESAGMRALLKRLKPTVFADIIALLALFRPGPLKSGMVDDFIDRKNGRKPVTYYDNRLKEILEETYGTFVYQEQVMQVSMEMCGFSAAKADKLRKGMGKKIKAVLDELRVDWIEGAKQNNYDAKLAADMWADILPFGEYAFNKSHSAAYGVLTMRTAYLKTHYPEETMAAVLSSYMGKTDKLTKYIGDCTKSGIQVLQPDINTSYGDFTAVPEQGIRFGLAGIRGIGEGVVAHIVEVRDEGGVFVNLHDFIERVDNKTVGPKAVESLIKAGCFDSTLYPRRQLFALVSEGGIIESAAKRQKDKDCGQTSMFDMFSADEHGFADEVPQPEPFDWDKKIRLAFEKEMLGVYASDHPLKELQSVLEQATDYSLDQIEDLKGGESGWFAGLLSGVSIRPTKKGPMMALLTLEDMGGSIECVVFPKTLETCREHIEDDKIVRIHGRFEADDRGSKILVSEIEPFDGSIFAAPPKRLRLQTTTAEIADAEFVAKLKLALTHYPGRDNVEIAIFDASENRTTVAIMGEKVYAEAAGLHGELAILLGDAGFLVK